MIEESKRDYTLTDPELAMFTSNLVVFMTRDAAEFAAKGVDAAAITALETLGNAFEVLPNDAFYRADVALAVDSKNAHRESSETKIREIVGCAKIKWGASSPYVKRFDVGRMTRAGDKGFLTTARQTVVVATSYLADLAGQGLTQAMIDSLGSEAQSMEDEMNNIAEKEAIRDIKTQERVDKGNELYGYVVQYCEIGKIIWQDVDEAKYNDYIIYPAEHPGLSKPQNVDANYDPLEPLVVTLSWDLVSEATSYDVYYDIAETGAPAGDFELLDNYPTSPIVIPATFEKRNYFKLKAKNDEDTSVYSDEVWVDVPAGPA